MNYLKKILNMRKKCILNTFIIATIVFSIVYLILNFFQVSQKIQLIAINIAIISFLFVWLFAHNTNFITRTTWYIGLGIGMIYLQIFEHEIYCAGSYEISSNILFILMVLAFAIVFLWLSKNIFGKMLHALNLIILSTYSLFMLSTTFSWYYFLIYNVEINPYYSNVFFSRFFSSCGSSIRYFFEFPPDEYLDMVTFFQFILGKIYEAVLIGSIASLVVKTIVISNRD